jgi:hypothetical protein
MQIIRSSFDAEISHIQPLLTSVQVSDGSPFDVSLNIDAREEGKLFAPAT